jgi:hypothetical protein
MLWRTSPGAGMPSQIYRRNILKGLGAAAMMLAPVMLVSRLAALIFILPTLLVALLLAAPALAAVRFVNRHSLLRYHLAIGVAVGLLMFLAVLLLVSGLEERPVSWMKAPWAQIGVAACAPAAFGAWCGFAWWCVFEGGEPLQRFFSGESLMKAHPSDW